MNREYQKELYLVVRLMELRRVMGGELLETRERQEEPLRLRQRKLLQAVENMYHSRNADRCGCC